RPGAAGEPATGPCHVSALARAAAVARPGATRVEASDTRASPLLFTQSARRHERQRRGRGVGAARRRIVAEQATTSDAPAVEPAGQGTPPCIGVLRARKKQRPFSDRWSPHWKRSEWRQSVYSPHQRRETPQPLLCQQRSGYASAAFSGQTEVPLAL